MEIYSQQPSPHSPAGDHGEVAGVIGHKGKCRCWGGKPGSGKLDYCVRVCGSTLNSEYMVSGYGCMLSAIIMYIPFHSKHFSCRL